jgi:hypothetical protein
MKEPSFLKHIGSQYCLIMSTCLCLPRRYNPEAEKRPRVSRNYNLKRSPSSSINTTGNPLSANPILSSTADLSIVDYKSASEPASETKLPHTSLNPYLHLYLHLRAPDFSLYISLLEYIISCHKSNNVNPIAPQTRRSRPHPNHLQESRRP